MKAPIRWTPRAHLLADVLGMLGLAVGMYLIIVLVAVAS